MGDKFSRSEYGSNSRESSEVTSVTFGGLSSTQFSNPSESNFGVTNDKHKRQQSDGNDGALVQAGPDEQEYLKLFFEVSHDISDAVRTGDFSKLFADFYGSSSNLSNDDAYSSADSDLRPGEIYASRMPVGDPEKSLLLDQWC